MAQSFEYLFHVLVRKMCIRKPRKPFGYWYSGGQEALPVRYH